MRCATSTRPPISIGGLASRSALATATRRMGDAEPHRPACPASSSNCWPSADDHSDRPARAARHFSFGAFNRDFLARGEGLSMLVLEGRARRTRKHSRAQDRRFRAVRVRARRHAARRHGRQGRVLAGLCRAIRRRPTSAPSPASTTPRRTSGIRPFAGPCQHGGRRRWRGPRRREPERPSHLSVGLHRRSAISWRPRPASPSRRRAATSR